MLLLFGFPSHLPITGALLQLRCMCGCELLRKFFQIHKLLAGVSKLSLQNHQVFFCCCCVLCTLELQSAMFLLQGCQLVLQQAAAFSACSQLCELAQTVEVQRIALLLQDVESVLQRSASCRRCCRLSLCCLRCGCAGGVCELQFCEPRIKHLLRLFHLCLLLFTPGLELLWWHNSRVDPAHVWRARHLNSHRTKSHAAADADLVGLREKIQAL